MIPHLAQWGPWQWALALTLLGAAVSAGLLVYYSTRPGVSVKGLWSVFPWVLGGLLALFSVLSLARKRRDATTAPAPDPTPVPDRDDAVLAIEREAAAAARDIRATDTSGMSTADVARLIDEGHWDGGT